MRFVGGARGPMLAVETLHGLAASFGGVLFLGLAYLNWRYIETITRAMFGERRSKSLAEHPFGDKIGGTVFVGVVGAVFVVAGVVQTTR